MNAATPRDAAAEINRLHAEVVRQADSSRRCLHAALVAAWEAGRLLRAERTRVLRTMGGAWGDWLKAKFKGSRGTAQNYIRLAEGIDDISALEGLSLRQTYLRLGIATEPKSRANSPPVAQLPAHIRFANKLLAELSACERKPAELSEAYRRDLRGLYERLRRLFEPIPEANFRPSPGSNRP